ncbi:hypothetical protein B0T17DRAFT_508338 [Bombardia bombarda]|uniref:Uncharacterized protein n=1 Tax=Bombardia bombarda TaxID=252184 RepID=A0AA40C5T4_9PEZI|nr:hypothetical protein B0T17DRAFT_508338 [Bombardia bombarda]
MTKELSTSDAPPTSSSTPSFFFPSSPAPNNDLACCIDTTSSTDQNVGFESPISSHHQQKPPVAEIAGGHHLFLAGSAYDFANLSSAARVSVVVVCRPGVCPAGGRKKMVQQQSHRLWMVDLTVPTFPPPLLPPEPRIPVRMFPPSSLYYFTADPVVGWGFSPPELKGGDVVYSTASLASRVTRFLEFGFLSNYEDREPSEPRYEAQEVLEISNTPGSQVGICHTTGIPD